MKHKIEYCAKFLEVLVRLIIQDLVKVKVLLIIILDQIYQGQTRNFFFKILNNAGNAENFSELEISSFNPVLKAGKISAQNWVINLWKQVSGSTTTNSHIDIKKE